MATDLAENEARLTCRSWSTRPRRARSSNPRPTRRSCAAETTRSPSPVSWATTTSRDGRCGFGTGAEPVGFVTIGQGQQSGNGIAVGPWDVRFVPDGVYRSASPSATHRPGWSTESRIVVTLDGRPPTVALSRPLDGGYVTAPGPIVGTATDANLVLLGARVGAGRGRDGLPVGARRGGPCRRRGRAGASAEWSPLPPDGVYTLRLTAARHRVELSASTRVTFTVDTTPPARPTGLQEKVTKAREGYGHVVVTWNANTEPDLAGYRISRRRRGAGVGPPPAAGLGRRRADRGSLRLLGRGGRHGWQCEPAGAATGPCGPHAPERGLPLAAAGRLGVGRGGGAGHGPQRQQLRRVPPVRGRGRVTGVLESPAALVGPRRGEPPWRVARARRRPVRPRARGRRHARQPRPGHPARRGRHPATRPARARRGGPSRHADRPARPEVGAEPLGRPGRLPRLPATGGWRTRPGSCWGTSAPTWCPEPPTSTTNASQTGVTATASWPWTEPATSPRRRTRSAPRWTTVRPSPSSSSPPTGRASAPPSRSWLARTPTWTWRASGSS